VNTAADGHATAAAEPSQFTTLSRTLHWLTAILVFSTLLIGFAMVSSVSDYTTLVKIHKTLGVVVPTGATIRVVNRLTLRAPGHPRRWEGSSEYWSPPPISRSTQCYWPNLWSGSGSPVVVFGSIRLPGIAPVDPGLYSGLRNTHSVLAFLLVAVVVAHVSVVLLHSITLRDGVHRRMAFRLPRTRPEHVDQIRRDEPAAPAASLE
jgi:cytochrome b561